jgi:hypothetical protein
VPVNTDEVAAHPSYEWERIRLYVVRREIDSIKEREAQIAPEVTEPEPSNPSSTTGP